MTLMIHTILLKEPDYKSLSSFHLAKKLSVEVGDTLVFQLEGTREQTQAVVTRVIESPGLMKGWVLVGFEVSKNQAK